MVITLDSFQSRAAAAACLVGVLLCAIGAVGTAADLLPGLPVSGSGLRLDAELGLAGLLVVTGAVAGTRTRAAPHAETDRRSAGDGRRPVYVTRSLLDTLLASAREAEPESLSVGLAVTPAGRLTGADEVPETMPVFTHLYVPERPNAVSSVFGVDLQTPPGRAPGRFVTHPFSSLALTKRDDLREVVLVAVPPWDDESVAAFDRRGRRLPLRAVDAVPPDETLPSSNQ